MSDNPETPDNVVQLPEGRKPSFGDVVARRPARGLPGCGLAAFVAILAMFFCVGVAGHGVSIWAVVDSADALRSSKLVYGGNVDPRTLVPMRDAGGIGQDEVPDAFHAETMDGTRACALSAGKVIRIEAGEVSVLPVAEVQRVVEADGTVTLHGATTSIVCPFGPDEGGERFARSIESGRRAAK